MLAHNAAMRAYATVRPYLGLKVLAGLIGVLEVRGV
jgi:hypothetical protein